MNNENIVVTRRKRTKPILQFHGQNKPGKTKEKEKLKKRSLGYMSCKSELLLLMDPTSSPLIKSNASREEKLIELPNRNGLFVATIITLLLGASIQVQHISETKALV